jgi:cob(I)alamin adenosyltransferase
MKIYTRTGDAGETSLFAGGRVSKGHVRIHTYGTVDELNAILGLALAAGLAGELGRAVQRVQAELFVVGADLATPLDAEAKWITRTSGEMTAALEQEIDAWDAALPPLKNFILPGGTMAAAFIHQARTVCRRAERWLAMLQETDPINPDALRYLNRLSDWLFVAAREANRQANQPETIWESPTRRS